MTRLLSPGRLAVAALAVLALVAHLVTGSALGGLQARLDNTANSAGAGTMLYTHTYNATTCTSVPTTITDANSVSCPGSLYPPGSTGARTDSIAANGTLPRSQVTQTVQATSCGAVQLDNRITPANPMLARYGTSFGSTGPMAGSAGITLDGAGPGGYETSTVQQAQPNPGLTLGSTYGLGIWFKTTSTSGGPLFGFGDSASNIAGTNDRILYLTAAGKLGFIFNTSGTKTGLSASSYNDGRWHFAYVTMQVTSILFLGIVSAITVYVDGTQVTTGGGVLIGLSSYQGYWHLGWSPAANGNPQQYLTGSLSNFVVLNSGTAPANLTVASSQAAFDTNTAGATTHWRLNDTGTTTESISLPVIGAAAPCSYVDIQWGFTYPLSCAAAPQSTTSACTVSTTTMSAFVASGAQTVSSAAPGTSQTSTITLAHDATYTGLSTSNFLPGLMIYAPLTITVKAVASTNWYTAFAWSAAGTGFVL